MSGKYRKFCCVVHNVAPGHKSFFEEKIDAKRLAIACEPYPNQDGYHYHIQIEYHNPRSLKSVLTCVINLSTRVVVPRPAEAPDGVWGRVQVDPMRGTWEQSTDYL